MVQRAASTADGLTIATARRSTRDARIVAVRALVPADRLTPRTDPVPAPAPPEEAAVTWGARPIATPLARYPGHEVRTAGGPDWVGPFVVEVEDASGATGVGASIGGPAACWLVERHLGRFVVGHDPAEVEALWDLMFRGSLFYGRKGIVLHAISAIDLALWDLRGKLADRPVFELIGGPVRDRVDCYATTPNAAAARARGFIGCKLPLVDGLAAGAAGVRRNVERFAAARQAVGDDRFLAYDCWMGLDLETAVELAAGLAPYRPAWLEECLEPDDYDGYRRLRRRLPGTVAVAAGEHEATRWGFRTLAQTGEVDVLQADPCWCGGLTELLKIIAEAETGGRRMLLHDSGPYGLHVAFARSSIPFAERILASPEGDAPLPTFGELFLEEPPPARGHVEVGDLRGPGFGLKLNPDIDLVRPAAIGNEGGGHAH